VDQVPAGPSTAEFDHYGISVTDLARSLEFYCDILGGVVVLPPHPVDEFSFRRAVIWLGSMGIDLCEHAMNRAEAFDPSRTGLDHLAFSVASHDALVAWAGYLDTKRVARSPIRRVDGVGEALDFRDPDGIQIELWHRDHGGSWARHVEQKLDQARSSRE
jgi:glyoxylase I family protein